MLIECVIDRIEPVVVPIGNETYEFKEDDLGRKVAEVWIESHIESFLACSHLYRAVKPAEGRKYPEPSPAELVTKEPDQVDAPEKGPGSVRALRAEYQRMYGKRPSPAWNGAKLREKIAAVANG